MRGDFPEFLLDETPWDFTNQPVFPSQAEFEAAVFQHLCDVQLDVPEIRPEGHWRPNEVVLRSDRVVIRYCLAADAPEACMRETQLRSDDGTAFSAGELFHKLHHAIIEDVRAQGHCDFEGLHFEGVGATGVPVYCLELGS